MTALRPDAGSTPGPFLVEGARRLDEWTRLAARLPALDAILEVDAEVLSRRLGSLPDEMNALVRLADGRRTVRDVIDDSGRPEIEAAAQLVALYADGVVRVVPPPPPLPTAAARGTPEPHGAEWFADPAEARRAAQSVETAIPIPDRVRGPEPVRYSQAPTWVIGAVLALAAAILLGPEWARRQGPVPAGPTAIAAEAPTSPAPAPPALAITERVPEGARLPPAEPRPSGASPSPVPAPAPVRSPVPPAYVEAMSAGAASYQAGDFSAAAASFQRAAGIRETSEAQASLGRALSDTGRPQEALVALRRATRLDASNGAAWLALGEVQLTGGDPAGARASYERYLAVDPAGRHAGEVRAVLARLRP